MKENMKHRKKIPALFLNREENETGFLNYILKM